MSRLFYLLIILVFLNSSLFSKELKKVTLQLSWFDQFQFAGYYMAKEKGFYEDLGLDVEIKPFNFGIDVPSLVHEKKVDFGIGRETLILERASGKKVLALYALFQSSPLVLLSTKNSGIDSISKFQNKKIMTTIDDASEVSLKAMISSQKIKVDNLNFIKHSHNINDLIEKKTDVISAYISKAPFLLQEKNIEYNIFSPKDFGFDMYSDFLFTNEELVKNNIDMVLAFKKASLKGWKYAYENIDEAVSLTFNKYNTQNLSKKELKFEALELKKLSYDKSKILGNIKEDKIQRIYDLYNVMGLVPNFTSLDKFVLYDDDNQKIFLKQKEKEYIKNNTNIKMCIVPNLKPYSFIENGELKGFVGDYFEIITKKTGLNFDLVKTNTLKESLEFLKNKKCEIITSLKNTKERESYINFTKPYTSLPFVLISRNDFPYIENLGILENKKIGLITNYAVNDELSKKYKNINFVELNSTKEGIKKVLNKELDGHIDFLHKSLYELYEEDNPKLKISNKLDMNIDISIAVIKDNEYLHSILNRVIDNISLKEKDEIIKKWISVEYKESTDFTLLWQVLGVLALIFVALLYKQRVLKNANKLLNEKVEEKTQELIKINKHLEERIKEKVEENLEKDKLLQRQSKMASLGQMIENIAHQWRQPLSVISTGASGIKIKKEMESLDDKFLLETLDLIVDSSAYLSHTIDDFRFFFKPNKQEEEFSLKNCFEKTLNILSSKFKDQDINIITRIDDISIKSYETELIQVFMNILNNAKDALVESNIDEKYIFINIYALDEKVIIKIKDNAGGIDSKIIDNIFEPYFSTKNKSQGTGIGLYMCEEIIVKHMNGYITVSNANFMYNNKSFDGAEFSICFY